MDIGESEMSISFDEHYSRKGRGLLDRIFGEGSEERARVSLTRPRHEREVVFLVDCQDREELACFVGAICGWLKEGGGTFEELNDFMLY